MLQTLTSTPVLQRVGTALSDPTRVRILVALRDAPAYPSELAGMLGVSRQSLSNHLACLRGCGLVVSVAEGRRSRYELVDPKLGHALTDLLGIVLAVDPDHDGSAGHDHRTYAKEPAHPAPTPSTAPAP
ncbi:ArsR/SmtB family transcription factor [Arthrobacter sp. MDT2-16]